MTQSDSMRPSLSALLVTALLLSGCVEVHFNLLSTPSGEGVTRVGEDEIRVEGADYDAQVQIPSSGTTGGLFGVLVPFVPIRREQMRMGTIYAGGPSNVYLTFTKKSADAKLVPRDVKLVIDGNRYGPSALRVNGTEDPDLAQPLPIETGRRFVFRFDDPGELPGSPFSLVVPGLPEMIFTPKHDTRWYFGL
jgi:hypothetical protein